MSFLNELKRRNVLRVGAAYIVSAWLVVQVVETIFPAFGFGDAAVRYVTIAAAVAFVPVLVLAWVFELTPEGLKRDAEVDRAAPASLQSAQRLDRIILVVLALALGYFAFDKFVLDPARDLEIAEVAREEGRSEALIDSYGDASIAVLAFENMSSDSEQEYFADGIAEEILNLLAAVPGLRVISRSSAFTYKGKDVPVPQIARELNVAHVLEGSVRKAGDHIRVTAQLIEGRTDTHLWSQTWDRTLDDIFAIQDEVAADVVGELQIKLTGAAPKSWRTNPETYALTLRARHLFEFAPQDFGKEGRHLLERALELDRRYVPALELSILADYLSSDGRMPEELQTRFDDFTRRILEIDPDNGVIQGYAAWDRYSLDQDIEGAARVLQQALEDHPNRPEIMRTAGAMFRRVGRPDLALPLIQQCVRLDPLAVQCLWVLKDSLLWAGNLDLAYEYMQRVRKIWNQPIRTNDVLLLLMRDDATGALEMMASWPETGQISAFRAIAAHMLGDMVTYEAELARFLEHEQGSDDAWMVLTGVMLFAFTGDPDRAFHRLDLLVEMEPKMAFMEVLGPSLTPLQGDPRWTQLRSRLNLGEERLEAIPFTMPPHIPPFEPRLGLDSGSE